MAIQKILIANRGEIACRVMKTCQKLGIATVAVYSEVDKNALHVEMADEAVHIGEAAAGVSYLVIEKIIAAAKQTGADAIHPCYGFLSENAAFAEAVKNAGLIFIGPPAAAIIAMGGKSESKALMAAAGVPLVLGYHGDNQDAEFLLAEAKKITFPVLIKASAGGGGKGMRVVDTADEFAEALMGAQREAQSSFGNAKVLVEKYLLRPRHVEIQVFADSHGNVVYLFERDCSIQRRHQKVLEEAPAPQLSATTREKMGAAAIAVAKAVNYVGAGTVEFLLDANEDFFFMEMNTRLQVEHPITEMITGVDLVEWQIKIAQGEKLPCTQSDLKINGHAFEVRLYAEDPSRDFMPSSGQIQFLQFPMESNGVRVDTGVREAPYGDGDVISMHYDPMIAKIITWGHDRATALQTMAEALDETHITGLKSNLHFLRALVRHPAFKDGNISTNFIKEHHEDLLPVTAVTQSHETLALAAIGILHQQEQAHLEMLEKSAENNSPWFDFGSWRIGGNDEQNFSFKNDAGEYTVMVTDSHLKFADGTAIEFSYDPCDFNMGFIADLQGKRIEAVVDRQGQNVTVCYAGHDDALVYLDPLHSESSDEEASGKLTAPMPGKVVAIRVEVGAAVKKGQPLVIVEAMKMEHTIVAPMDGIIDKIHAAVGRQVDEKYELVSMQ